MDFYFLGDDELVTAFRSIGIYGMTVNDAEEAVEVFRKITEGPELYAGDDSAIIALYEALPGAEGCQVLIVTEEIADWLGDYLINWQLSGRYPLIVEIPGIMGRLEGRKTLVDSIREAIGIHI
ncbi:MAG: ATPase V [Treponema sp.]|jgi:V/A-type H+-transporting ATPase subunit F|nr:ATPase V [Treponema sp.]